MKQKKQLIKGNHAIGKAAIEAGCNFYAGYPITPQNELTEYMAKHMRLNKRPFVQAESEVSAINMVFGAGAGDARAMTSSSSPGVSLKQEGISYIAGAELPCVIVNMVRGGPGLGNIAGAQSDYFQSTRGGGHGDYRLIVFGPNSVQELYDFTMKAFDYADKYRMPVMILGDGYLGQMMESYIPHKYEPIKNLPKKKWALTGCKGRKKNIVKTLYLTPENALEEHNLKLNEKYKKIQKEIQMYEKANADDGEIIVVSYGTASRVVKNVIEFFNKNSKKKIGMFRPISLWPFPATALRNLKCKKFLVVEMSMGQMIEDVKLALFGKKDVTVNLIKRPGGMIPTEDEIKDKIEKMIG
ncbi:3-methyl-2-oxobutanoate dehydrogenase subunit VorB [Candidatus Woesearchaeota archaeon]|nr:3-methyl-2-oxobutanoate dehydrogenase subunit VorB [Candidatus Woesearchaeota archaeon]